MKNPFRILIVLLLSLLSIERMEASHPYSIYPIPQSVSYGKKAVRLSSEINVIAESAVTDVIKNRINERPEQAGYTCQYSSAARDDKTNLYVGENGSGEKADR